MKLHYHPVSSYSQKALVGLHEKGAAFTPAILQVFSAEARAAFRSTNPYGKVPVLELPDGTLILESSVILDWVDAHVPGGTPLIPPDRDLAIEVRSLDRRFDLYVNDPMSIIFFDGRRPEAERNPRAVAAAKATLDASYVVFDKLLASRAWAAGDAFSLADCAAAPALQYASLVYPFDRFENLTAYLGRLRSRPTFARVLTEAAPILARMMS
jgi:glutathione S-transferase